MPLRKALFGACLALPLAGFAGVAHARNPQPEQVIRVPAGAVVLVLPAAAMPQAAAQAMPMPEFAPHPMLRMMAAQDAMMQQMLQQVRALDQWSMALPNPQQIIQAAMRGMPHVAPGSSVMTTVVSNGRNVCRETISYRMTPDGARPQVHVVRTGNDCGALHVQAPVGAAQMLPPPRPAQREAAPAAASPHHLWTISDPARPMTATPPRT